MDKGSSPDWRDTVFDTLKANEIYLYCYLPDGGLAKFIERARREVSEKSVMLTTEEEGVGICCGSWLGGKRAVLMIQSSGVGNCINAFSLITNCRFPFFMLVSMRGEFGEGNPWQIPMGSRVQEVLELSGFHVYRATAPQDAIEMTAAGLKMAWRSDVPVAVLLSQRLLGAKDI